MFWFCWGEDSWWWLSPVNDLNLDLAFISLFFLGSTLGIILKAMCLYFSDLLHEPPLHNLFRCSTLEQKSLYVPIIVPSYESKTFDQILIDQSFWIAAKTSKSSGLILI